MKIMSVDDSRAMRLIIKNAVEVLGYEFVEAANGREAVDYLEKDPSVDLILLDWNMPVMDGMETLKNLKSNPRLQNIPVTMVTTEVERQKVIEAISKGARNYVMKPFTQEALIAKILESLGMGV
jgi:two-component system, chemotaxis family, chemotaxis protein CheY